MKSVFFCFAGTAGETTVITGLTPGETYILRLVATSEEDRARASISIHIPAHSGSCYVHFTNRGKQLMDNGAVLVDFGSTGPVTSYTCSLDRGPEESCEHSMCINVTVPRARTLYAYFPSLQVLILISSLG